MVLPPELVGLIEYLPTLSESVRRVVLAISAMTSSHNDGKDAVLPDQEGIAQFHFSKLSWLVPQDKLNSGAMITHYHGPLFQSHGTMDRTIPISLGKKLFEAANGPRRFVSIEGADHNDCLPDTYLQQLGEFVDSAHIPKLQEPVIKQAEKPFGHNLLVLMSVICGCVLILPMLVKRKTNSGT